QIANVIYHKLESYWSILNELSQVSAFLDLWVKMSVCKTEYEKDRIINLVSELNKYLSEKLQFTDLTDNLTNERDYF
ncbi:3637_t:CDS:1, partial [Racocetra persica]